MQHCRCRRRRCHCVGLAEGTGRRALAASLSCSRCRCTWCCGYTGLAVGSRRGFPALPHPRPRPRSVLQLALRTTGGPTANKTMRLTQEEKVSKPYKILFKGAADQCLRQSTPFNGTRPTLCLRRTPGGHPGDRNHDSRAEAGVRVGSENPSAVS